MCESTKTMNGRTGGGSERDASRAPASPKERARSAGLRMLALRSRTEGEVRRRLEDRGFDVPCIDETVAWLKSLGYLDDRAYAQRYVEARTKSKPMGPGRIALELRRKGIDGKTAEEALEAIGPAEELELARRAAQEWVRRNAGGDPGRAFRRLVAHLGRRGFSPDAIRRAAREALSRDADL